MSSGVDHEAYYLTWYDTDYADPGLYAELFSSSSQDESYDDTYYLTYEVEDFPSQPRYTNREKIQDYRGSESPYNGTDSWLRDYTSYFGSSLEREDSSRYGDNYENYYDYNDMEVGNNEDQWSRFDRLDDQDLLNNSSWDYWEEMELYERIFGF